MDPNANLAEQREIAQRLLPDNDQQRLLSRQRSGAIERDAARLAELVVALDEWLVKGGFSPTAWVERTAGFARGRR